MSDEPTTEYLLSPDKVYTIYYTQVFLSYQSVRDNCKLGDSPFADDARFQRDIGSAESIF